MFQLCRIVFILFLIIFSYHPTEPCCFKSKESTNDTEDLSVEVISEKSVHTNQERNITATSFINKTPRLKIPQHLLKTKFESNKIVSKRVNAPSYASRKVAIENSFLHSVSSSNNIGLKTFNECDENLNIFSATSNNSENIISALSPIIEATEEEDDVIIEETQVTSVKSGSSNVKFNSSSDKRPVFPIEIAGDNLLLCDDSIPPDHENEIQYPVHAVQLENAIENVPMQYHQIQAPLQQFQLSLEELHPTPQLINIQQLPNPNYNLIPQVPIQNQYFHPPEQQVMLIQNQNILLHDQGIIDKEIIYPSGEEQIILRDEDNDIQLSGSSVASIEDGHQECFEDDTQLVVFTISSV